MYLNKEKLYLKATLFSFYKFLRFSFRASISSSMHLGYSTGFSLFLWMTLSSITKLISSLVSANFLHSINSVSIIYMNLLIFSNFIFHILNNSTEKIPRDGHSDNISRMVRLCQLRSWKKQLFNTKRVLTTFF